MTDQHLPFGMLYCCPRERRDRQVLSLGARSTAKSRGSGKGVGAATNSNSNARVSREAMV